MINEQTMHLDEPPRLPYAVLEERNKELEIQLSKINQELQGVLNLAQELQAELNKARIVLGQHYLERIKL